MRDYILKRIWTLIPVLFIVSIVVFSIIHLTPGDPAAVMLGDQASDEEIQKVREQLGLNEPIVSQYIHWFTSIFKGDFGYSYFMNKPVLSAIYDHLGPTISLTIMAEIFAILFAIPLGVIAAKRKGTFSDQSIMVVSLVGISIPSFLLALFLVLIFSVQLRWLPVAGYIPFSTDIVAHYKHLLLPSIALGTMQASLIVRMTRASLLDVLSLDFIKALRAKGVKERVVIFNHALRNSFVPIITVIGQSIGTLVAGAAVTETIFNIPGIGQLILNSVERRDYAIIQGSILFVTFAYLIINLLIDVVYGVIDPRIRIDKK